MVAFLNSYYCEISLFTLLKRFSIERRKIKIKAIATTNYSEEKSPGANENSKSKQGHQTA